MSTRPPDAAPAPTVAVESRPRSGWNLERLAAELLPALPRGPLLLAFSGGADSTALLLALLRVPGRRRLTVMHVDHGLDPASTDRAEEAQRLAEGAATYAGWRFVPDGNPGACSDADYSGDPGVPGDRLLRYVTRRLRITGADRRRHGGIEAAARARRYDLLARVGAEELRLGGPEREAGSDEHPTRPVPVVLTAHHADDQLETLLLRMRQGTGLMGLAGIRETTRGPRDSSIRRPLLALAQPPTGADLRDLLRQRGASWIEDPTNDDPSLARNAVRRHILPMLERNEPGPRPLPDRGIRLARAAARFAAWRSAWARDALDLRPTADGADLDFASWRNLPVRLREQGLGALHRAAGLRADPPAAARAELFRQLEGHGLPKTDLPAQELSDPQLPDSRQLSHGPVRCTEEAAQRVACAAGAGRQWVVGPRDELEARRDRSSGSGARLQLRPEPTRSHPPNLGDTADFTYTPRIPGVTEMPEFGCSLQVTREPYDGWMTRAWPDRAACHLPDPRATVTVRNRTNGDTLQPFGSPSKRVKLKKLLIDRKIPRDQRSFLPLVCVDGEIAWVPGVTIGDSFRIPDRLTGEGPHPSHGRFGKSDGSSPSKHLVWVFRLLPTDATPTVTDRSQLAQTAADRSRTNRAADPQLILDVARPDPPH